MQPISVLIIIYSFITLGTAATLYFTFRGKFDTSAMLFLAVEILMLGVVGLNFLARQNPNYAVPWLFFLSNFLVITSEIVLIFSIYGLDRKVNFTKLYLLIFLSAIYCIFMEYARVNLGATSPIAFQCSVSALLAFIAAYVCRTSIDVDLKRNQFLKLISYLQIGVGLISMIRFISFFTSDPIAPRNPNVTSPIVIFFAIYLTLNVFRYITYQSLRISWVSMGNTGINFLNRNLFNLIHEKEQLLQNLINSNRMIGVSALASSLSHELSQPLTSIALQTEAVKRDLSINTDNTRSIKSLDNIGSQINRLSVLVKNLRQLFKSQNSQLASVDLASITDELIEILNFNLHSPKITLTKNYQSKPIIDADPIQIQQVLINLLNNSIESISETNLPNKEITISIWQDDKNAMVSVHDTGIGIRSELLPIIFDLYKSSKGSGLGIGLWLSKTIIDKHKGTIAASNNSGGGANFTIAIPLSQVKS
ncbi:sensor histidine kinase [Polynucleobacter ibericus]|uniref:sensor histidine kinase n=1 Tax=Polynucleobacter ibericus TaxID=1819725 RepID=UPI001BFE65C7|nr:HAMP domain-containing sensor histidine kinase [Polynucleobacter ibericus]QWE08155.1 HAMP domain-containing histidine kinase [Polynucleobacter ibericus]